MKGIIVYDAASAEKNKYYIDLYYEQGKLKNIDFELLIIENIEYGIFDSKPSIKYNGKTYEDFDFAIVRTDAPLLSKHIENMGKKVFNSSFISEIANDKRRTYELLSSLGIPMLDMWFDSCKNPVFPLIVKPSRGHGGQGVTLVKNIEEYNSAIEALKPDKCVIQSLASERGKDLRVYVVGKEIIAGILRTSDTDIRSNYSLGGHAQVYNLNDEEKALVNKIISHFDFSMVGIDFLFNNGSLVFNEIEDIVGARMLYATTSINIVEKYVEFIKKSLAG